jgi:hypothetical protein
MFAWAALRPVVKIKVVPAHAWHQVILPVGLQLIVLATVAYDYFSPLPDATKIMMMLVLTVAAIQILLAWRATTRRTRDELANSAALEAAARTRTAAEDGERGLGETLGSGRQRPSRPVVNLGPDTFRGVRLSGTVTREGYSRPTVAGDSGK